VLVLVGIDLVVNGVSITLGIVVLLLFLLAVLRRPLV
jgi:hypothetical protein